VVATILNFVVIFDQTKMLYVSEANLAFIFSTGKYIHTYFICRLAALCGCPLFLAQYSARPLTFNHSILSTHVFAAEGS